MLRKRKKLSEAQLLALTTLAFYLCHNFDRRTTLIRSGDPDALEWHRMRLAYRIIGKPTHEEVKRHLEEFIYR